MNSPNSAGPALHAARLIVLALALLSVAACHWGGSGTAGTPAGSTGSGSTGSTPGGGSGTGSGGGSTLTAPSALSYSSPLTAVVGTAITSLTPTVTGTVTGYVVSPAFPAGLALDGTSGVISGTPSVVATQATYTITASNSAGTTTFDLTLTVNAAATGSTGSSDPTGPGTFTPATTRSMIADALAQGRIDLATSLVYRIWAVSLDPQLPEEYDGPDDGTEDNGLFEEIQLVWSTLPADAQAAIQPYLLRPNDPASPYSGGSSQSTFSRSRAKALVRHADGSGGTPQCSDWVSTTMDSAPIRVWVCHTSDSEDQAVLGKVVAIFDRHYAEMTYDMGPPLRDDGTGQDDLIDVYILDKGDCIQRSNQCKVLTPVDPNEGDPNADHPPTGPLALTIAAPPAAGSPGGWSAYMLLQKARALVGGTAFEADVVHEFYHVLQFAHIATGTRIVHLSNGQIYFDHSWFVEASAKWAEWAYVPASSPTEVHVWYPASYDTELELFDGSSYQPGSVSLLEGSDSQHAYASYIWPYFMQQELGGPEYVGKVWRSVDFAAGPVEINRAINSQLNFADHFRDFTVRNLNTLLPGDPLEKHFWDMDVQFPKKAAHPVISMPDLYPTLVLVDDMQRVPSNIEIPNLAAKYRNFEVDPASGIQRILLEFEVDEPDALDVDAIAEVVPPGGGDPAWKRFKSPDGRRLEFCLPDPEQHIDKFILVMSNHDDTASTSGVLAPKTTGKLYLTTDALCGEWTGTITYTFKNLTHQETTDELGTEVTQDHEVLTQSWAVTSVATDPDLPGTQQLTLSWVGTDEVNDTYDLTPAAACSGTLHTYTTGTRSLQGTVKYDIYPGPDGSISMGPPYGLAPPASPTVTWTPQYTQVNCEGPEITDDASQRTLSEQFGAAISLYGPVGGFTPDPKDPTHYFGSNTTTIAPDITATVSWDLRHHATAQPQNLSGSAGTRRAARAQRRSVGSS